jgi:radical SAM protein with 4Fe4S-binding SPASM domain
MNNHISWNVTKKCNLYCKHCYRESSPEVITDSELTTEEGKKLLEEMYGAGFRIIVFSGGEPLLREDIFDLIQYADTLGMITLMGSNGTLITEAIAKKLKSNGLKAIAISIDHIDPIIHNTFRGSDQAFDQAVSGISHCMRAGLNVQVNCTITKENLLHLDQIMDFTSNIGASSCHMLFLVDVGRGKNLSDTLLSKPEYKYAINQIIDKQLDIRIKPTCAPQYKVEALLKGVVSGPNIRGCIAGISYCSILPNGDVHICPYAPIKVANVREETFDDIWKYNEIFKQLRDFTQYKGKCGNCQYIHLCGGCRARAYNNSGDWLGEDPYCLI